MNEPKKSPVGGHDQSTDDRPTARKRYQKPAFTREQLFETMALACGKMTGAGGQCQFVKKTS